jgi:hypothetical protein
MNYSKEDILKIKDIIRNHKSDPWLLYHYFEMHYCECKYPKMFLPILKQTIKNLNKKHIRKFWKNRLLDTIDILTNYIARDYK